MTRPSFLSSCGITEDETECDGVKLHGMRWDGAGKGLMGGMGCDEIGWGGMLS